MFWRQCHVCFFFIPGNHGTRKLTNVFNILLNFSDFDHDGGETQNDVW